MEIGQRTSSRMEIHRSSSSRMEIGRSSSTRMETDGKLPQNHLSSTTTIHINGDTAPASESDKPYTTKRLILLLVNVLLVISCASGGPLLLRVYFLHGGKREWFASFLQSAAFPFLLPPLFLSFLRRRRLSPTSSQRLFLITPPLFLGYAAVGVLTGIDNFLFSYGVSYLPASTSSLLISTQLGCTAIFAFFIVKQKFTASSINAVALLTFGAVILGVHSNGDRPAGESKSKYFIGFVMTLGAAALYGLILPLMELLYSKSKQAITYTLVMEIQFVIGAAATAFCVVGMVVNNDFQVLA